MRWVEASFTHGDVFSTLLNLVRSVRFSFRHRIAPVLGIKQQRESHASGKVGLTVKLCQPLTSAAAALLVDEDCQCPGLKAAEMMAELPENLALVPGCWRHVRPAQAVAAEKCGSDASMAKKAPGVGLEPTTQRLTAACSTN